MRVKKAISGWEAKPSILLYLASGKGKMWTIKGVASEWSKKKWKE
jgi:hypothetical protein